MITLTLSILQTLIDWDTAIFLWFNSFHTDYWDNFMEMFTGRFVLIPFYLSIAFAVFRKFHWKAGAFFILAAVVLLIADDQLGSSIIRPAIGRLRPSNPDNPISTMVYVVDGYRGGRFGFPSAHAANSAGLAFLIIFLFRQRLLSLTMVLWLMLVCYSRMYLGVHYFGDVVAGVVLGLVNAAIVWLLSRSFLPDIVASLRPFDADDAQMRLPVYVCCASVVVMLLLAFFVDPSVKL